MYKMIELIIITCVAASALSSTLEPFALRRLRLNPLFPDGRIVGGVETDIREVPYQVALEYDLFQFCGGSLISESHVLTAAHCLDITETYIRVRVGSSKRQEEGTIIRVKTKLLHPQYGRDPHDYDVGILPLAERAPISDWVKPVPVSEREAPVSARLKISGWGVTTEGGENANVLHSVHIPLISRLKCQEIYAITHKITSRMICAYEAGKDSCQGDSGGPAAVDGELYGIVSWGVGCARPGKPGVYANVADREIRDFIRKHAHV